ncbi:MAG: hypothetical protein NTW41_09710 [Verrucomicrobia bacterium]|nr:hypothetical protein [Verrucomicrobiota bacterium]
MRGSPILRLVLVAGALILLALPVWQLTLQTPSPIPAKPAAVAEDLADYRVILKSSGTARLQAMVANQPTVSSASGVENFEAVFSMSANEPEDIAVFADFVDRTRSSALRVSVEKGGEVLVEKTFWGTGVVEDVVEIPTK